MHLAGGPADAQVLAGRWDFEEGVGITAADGSGNDRTATFKGGVAAWAASPVPIGEYGLRVATKGCAQAAGPVVNTMASFTAATWVKMDSVLANTPQTFLSIDGNNVSGFFLQLDPNKRFAFLRRTSDSVSSGATSAASTSEAISNTWYHVAAVYNSASNPRLQLYVNGALAGSANYNTSGAWRALGDTVIGRGKFDGGDRDFASGQIDDVRFYSSALNLSQVQALYQMGVTARFGLFPKPAHLLVAGGGTSTGNIAVIPLNGFTGTVSFVANDLPAGVTADFSPSPADTETTMTLTADPSVATGSYNFTVTGTSGTVTRSTGLGVMVTSGDTAEPYTWPSYSPNLNYDFRTDHGPVEKPTQVLDDDNNVTETIVSDWWSFRYGANKNSLVTSAAWIPMLNRLNNDFAYFRDNMGWQPDKRAKRGFFSSVYMLGSGMEFDPNTPNTTLGGYQGSIYHEGEDWPMILLSYYPIYCFDPACTYDTATRVGQQGAVVHEGIHALLADQAGCKGAAWIQEGGNTWLQGEMNAQLTGDYSSMGFLSAGSVIAPFMPVECYSGWLQDGSFGGPSAEGVYQGNYGSTWRQVLGGVQYSEAFCHFMGEIVSPGSVAWIWNNCTDRVLDGLARAPGGLGNAQARRLIMEYRARSALCDFGKWSAAYQKALDDNWNGNIRPEITPYWVNSDVWRVSCYVATTNNNGELTPAGRTLPGWSGANFIPLTVSGTGTVNVNFTPLGNTQVLPEVPTASGTPVVNASPTSHNMTCQLVYRATDGTAVYSQPVSAGTCSLRLDKAPKNNVVIAVITNTDYTYEGESSRRTKFDYRLTLGPGVTGTASTSTRWYTTIAQPALKVLPGNGENSLFWGTIPGATSYTIKRSTTIGGPYTNIVTQAATTYKNTGLANGTTYYYIATATGTAGTSVNSEEVTGTPFPPDVTTLNFGFETPVTSTFSSAPSNGNWTFTSTSGVSANNSTYTSGNRASPQGNQVAFLQNTATISQAIPGFTAGRSYTVKFLASQRQNVAASQLGEMFDLTVDGTRIGSFYPNQLGKGYGEFSATFTATADTHTLAFTGTNLNGGNNTVFLDRVMITTPPGALETWRMANFGTTANTGDAADDADPDGDGWANWQEFVAGTNPKDISSLLKVTAMEQTGNDLTLTFDSVANKVYRLECSDTLKAGSWTVVETGTADNNITGTGASVRITQVNGGGEPARFYRVVVSNTVTGP